MGRARRRHTPEQIIRKLREADRLLGEGQEVSVVAKQLVGRRGNTTLDRPQPIVRNRVRVKWACRVYERLSAASGRIDVLVEVKQVVRVVAPLQLD